MAQPIVQFTEDERDFIDGVLGLDSWPFHPECDPTEYSKKDVERILGEVAVAIKPYEGIVDSIAVKVVSYAPKPNYEIVSALQTVMSKHKMQIPAAELEKFSIEVSDKLKALAK